jgi:hypothetical protein
LCLYFKKCFTVANNLYCHFNYGNTDYDGNTFEIASSRMDTTKNSQANIKNDHIIYEIIVKSLDPTKGKLI